MSEHHKTPERLIPFGDAVVVADRHGRVVFMNAVAEALTGWLAAQAAGRPLERVFQIVNEQTRRPAEDPVARVLAHGAAVGLANHTILIARDGTERPIDDSAAPLRTAVGDLQGAVLVFREVSGRHSSEHDVYHQANTFAQQCVEHAEQLEPFAGESASGSAMSETGRSGSLLEDLQRLYVAAQHTLVRWVIVNQGAMAARDKDLLEVVKECHGETELQMKWLLTRIKTAAPQALTS